MPVWVVALELLAARRTGAAAWISTPSNTAPQSAHHGLLAAFEAAVPLVHGPEPAASRGRDPIGRLMPAGPPGASPASDSPAGPQIQIEGCANSFMQLVGTRGVGRRAGHIDAPCLADPRRRRSARRVGLALQARAPGGDDAGCSAGRRPGGSAPGGCGRRSAASPGTRPGPSGALARRTRPPWAFAPGVTSTSPPSEWNTSSKRWWKT